MPAATSPIVIDINSDNDIAVVRARPGCAPMFGVALIAIVSALVFVLLGGLDDLSNVSWLAYAGSWAIGSTLIFCALLFLQSRRYTIARLNGRTRSVEIFRRGRAGRRNIDWNCVVAAITPTATDRNGGTVFGLSLVLRDGEQVVLVPCNYPEGRACDEAARELNRFLRRS